MTRLGVIGDIHACVDRLEDALQRIDDVGVNGILLVGDIGSSALGLARKRTRERDARYLRSVEDMLERCGSLGVPVLWVPGNHDLPTLGGEGNVDHRMAEIDGLRVSGIGGAGPSRFGFCYEWSEAEIRARKVPECDVLLVHCPPARTSLDWVPRFHIHAGSEAIRERAEQHHGVLVCGHIHESAGVFRVGDCLCMNVGGLGQPFGRSQVGFIEGTDRVVYEDLEDGLVEELQR